MKILLVILLLASCAYAKDVNGRTYYQMTKSYYDANYAASGLQFYYADTGATVGLVVISAGKTKAINLPCEDPSCAEVTLEDAWKVQDTKAVVDKADRKTIVN